MMVIMMCEINPVMLITICEINRLIYISMSNEIYSMTCDNKEAYISLCI